MINETNKSYFEWVSKHWIVITALATLITSILGGVSSTIYYSAFHVNYTELAELNDFIKHAISRPFFCLILVVVFLTVSAQTYVLYKSDKATSELRIFYKNKKYIKNFKLKKSYYLKDMSVILAKSFLIFLISVPTITVLAKLEIRNLKKTESELYNVDTDSRPLHCVSYVGRINVNHIFWSRKTDITTIIPSSFKRMTYFTSLDKRPTEFAADNQVKTREYIQWQKHIKQVCGEDFDIPEMR
ncbi:hypothetical protein KO533_04670 [Shewanella sp. NKUCC05_KAH]|uniref:hypothetical protein n=1 Tax=Shewanella sp. NKUCC05_KAH TaxID=2842126 RepID=UPI001C5AAD0F|nr:hypothetical protein [Shewanella sp. NKUCC05_KAH]MBW3525865.1 hypothetical protein [Shewanella sp. NKUCC05_KAH]